MHNHIEKERYFRLKYEIPKGTKIDRSDIELYNKISDIANSEKPVDEIKNTAQEMLKYTAKDTSKIFNNYYYLSYISF